MDRQGLERPDDDPRIFNREDATVILGVGKNMVASIRYWLQATVVANAGAVRRTPWSAPKSVTSCSANAETPTWRTRPPSGLLHWLLATNPAGATAIYWFFNHFHKPTFTQRGSRHGAQRLCQARGRPQGRSIDAQRRCATRASDVFAYARRHPAVP